MRTRYRAPVLAALLPLVLAGVGCNLVRAKAAFKDGNRLYKEENYRRAIDEYQKAVQLRPDFAEAHFYLASSHQSLFRPGKEGDENKMRIQNAIEHYEKALELNKANTPNLQQIRLNTLGALTAIYSEPPLSNYEKALSYAEQLVKDNPNDIKNLYAMANLYEKFNRVAEAEQTYEKVAEQNPNDAKACGALAAFYNKPLWDEKGEVWVEGKSTGARRIKFEKAIATLNRCADIDPANPNGHYTLAMFYWDKAYRDPVLTDAQKADFADKGIEAVDVALQAQPDHVGSIVGKGLLYRVKAQLARNPAERKRYLDQAVLLQKQAADLRKSQQEQGGAGAGTAIPPEAAAATK
jgi:tetratricopeptide (TPR) repeat protein